jgi:hypothetical protein
MPVSSSSRTYSNYTDHLVFVDHRHMAEPSVLHQAQCIHRMMPRRQVRRLAGHYRGEAGMRRIAALGQQAHGVSPGEDAYKVALIVHDDNCSDAMAVHLLAGILNAR